LYGPFTQDRATILRDIGNWRARASTMPHRTMPGHGSDGRPRERIASGSRPGPRKPQPSRRFAARGARPPSREKTSSRSIVPLARPRGKPLDSW